MPAFLPSAGGSLAGREDARLEQYHRWFAHVRWVAALLALLLVIFALELGFLPKRVFGPLLATVGGLGLSNLAYSAAAVRRWLSLRVLLFVQLSTDLALLILMLHLSGGIESPLYLLPVFNVLLAGIVLPRRQCFLLAWAGGLSCAGAVCAEWTRFLPHFTLLIVPHGVTGQEHEAYDATYVTARSALQLGMMLLTAHFVSRLAEQAWAYERGLAVAAEDARTGRELLEQALENTGVGVRVVDGDLRALFVSEQWRRWFPQGAEEEQTALLLATAPDSALRRTLQDSSIQRSELAIGGLEPPERCFAVTTAPLHDRSGRTDRAVELVQDVTAEKESQRRLLKASQLAAVGEIAGKLAHEINNPTAIISAKGRILLSDRQAEMSPKVTREVERIVALADRIAGIAKGLLAYGRPSPAPHRPIDPIFAVRSALSLVEHQATRQSVSVVDELDATACVSGSIAELEQVFLNLFLNALDAMPGGGSLTISSRSVRVPGAAGEALEIVVADSGHGIEADVREHVFEPFFTTKEEGRGSGLGLAICLGIVRSHGGEIEVESEAGRGARFAVRLPALQAEVVADA
jgi:signal transduction histidine kinase